MSKFSLKTLLGCSRYLVENPHLVSRLLKDVEANDIMTGESDLQVKALRKLFTMLKEWDTMGRIKSLDVAAFESELRNLSADEINEEVCRLWAKTKCDKEGKPNDLEVYAISRSEGSVTLFADYIKAVKIRKWFPAFSSSFQSGHIDEAIQSTRKLIPDLETVNIQKNESFDFDDVDKFLNKMNTFDVTKYLKIGINKLDDERGFYEPGTLNIMAAGSGSGKSQWATHLVRQSIAQGHYISMTCVEDRPETVLPRLLACLTGIPVKKLQRYYNTLTPEEKISVAKAQKKLKKHLRLSFIYGESVDVIHAHKIEEDARCQLAGLPTSSICIIDYSQHISAKSIGNAMWERIESSYRERKTFALKYKKIVFDFIQINREGLRQANASENKLLTLSDVAGSFNVVTVCDSVLSLNRNDLNIASDTATIYVAKSREGGRGLSFSVGTEFEKARFNFDECNKENANK
jgi:replicative DNA helicase